MVTKNGGYSGDTCGQYCMVSFECLIVPETCLCLNVADESWLIMVDSTEKNDCVKRCQSIGYY